MNYKQISYKNSTYIFEVTYTKEEIIKQNTISEKELVKDLEIEGFRKGKVPHQVGKKHIKKDDIFQKTLSALLSEIYSQIIKNESLKTISNPQIKLVNAKPDQDWQINIHIAVQPKFDLPDYKKLISQAKSELKKDEIWVPGKSKQEKQKPTIDKEKLLQKIFNQLLNSVEIEVPELLIENELNKRISQLVDDVQKAGLTMESYLSTKGLTKDKLNDNTKKEIAEMFKLEFMLDKIADNENITVTDQEIEDLTKQFKDNQKDLIQKNLYFYTILLRRQKLLDYLSSL